jgi:thiamine biosynthesis lipoprotein
MKRSIVLLIAAFLVVLFSSCSINKDKPYEANGFGMGTIISQKLYGANSKKAANEAFEKIKYLEGIMTINETGGEINKLNENAGKGNIAVNAETIKVFESALKISDLSQGAFDITVAPVVKLWGIGSENPRVPSENEIRELLPLIDYKSVLVDKKENRVGLEKLGQMVDLGGIAKGYAGDAIVRIYKNNNIRSALVNLGGNVVTLGKRPDGSLWTIGIQNPRAANGSYVGTVKVSDKAVVTSGDYQRYYEKDGKRYHHIIDPKTGEPAQSGLMSVTVVADSSTDADGLSTAAFVLGLDKGMQLIEHYGQAEAIFITTDKKIYITEGLEKLFNFSDESGEYYYVEKR